MNSQEGERPHEADVDTRVAHYLESWEQNTQGTPFGSQVTELSAQGGVVTLVSDLHLAGGARRDGSYDGTENFFAGESFRRFLEFLADGDSPVDARAPDEHPSRPRTLVIAGDFIDFLRVTRIPRFDQEFLIWRAALAQIGMTDYGIARLRDSISDREELYGLKTDHFKSVWKLASCVSGHADVFEALAMWIARGNRLVIVKGNHDLEWFWQPVRNYLRLVLATKIRARERGDSEASSLREALDIVLPLLDFVDHAAVIDHELYVEHGHRYEKKEAVRGAPALPGGRELNLPFGSFFDRYVLHPLELAFPFIDNVRPRGNILPLLIRDRFPVALKLLVHHLLAVGRNTPITHWRFMLGRTSAYVALFVATGLIVLVVVGVNVSPVPSRELFDRARDVVLSLAALVGGYTVARLMAEWHLKPPASGEEYGRMVLGLAKRDSRLFWPESTAGFRIAAMGHTHRAWQYEEDDRWFFNLGAWMPTYDVMAAAVQWETTFTLLEVHPARDDGTQMRGRLLRWNDDAGRTEPVVTIRSLGE